MSTRTEAPRARRVTDAEIQALAEINQILLKLEDDSAVARTLSWLLTRHCPGKFKLTLGGEPVPAQE